MRRLSYIQHTAWILCLTALTLASCQIEQEDNFTRSSSERLQDAMDQVKQTLRSSEYGWEFDYYPGGALAYGGITYVVKFDSLTADVSCSLLPDSTATSFYRITNDNGPVLTFDTYNELLHFFSTPSSREYEAKGGEFEFVVNEITDTLITFYGKKTRNTMYMRRIKAPVPDYADKTIHLFDSIAEGFKGQIGTAAVEGSINFGNRRLSVVANADTTSMPFTFTNKGIRLYQPVTIGGKTISSLDYSISNNLFTSADAGNADISLEGIPTPEGKLRFYFYEGNYNLRYDGNARTARVSLVPSRMDGTYRMRGLSPNYELILNFDYETGKMTLGPQVIGDIAGATVYFLTFASETGRVYLDNEATLTLNWNGNTGSRISFTFSTTHPEKYPCDSAVLYLIAYDEDGNTEASLVSQSGWTVNGSALLPNLNSLQKLRN